MVPRGHKFTLEAAAEGVIQMWKVLIPDPGERVKQAHQIQQWCVEDQEKMVAEATSRGMEQHVDAVPGAVPGAAPAVPGAVPGVAPRAPLPGSGVVSTIPNTATRSLSRVDTNEEYERMKKKRETYQMKLELAEMQHKMEDRSHRSPEVSEQKEQAETKEQK